MRRNAFLTPLIFGALASLGCARHVEVTSATKLPDRVSLGRTVPVYLRSEDASSSATAHLLVDMDRERVVGLTIRSLPPAMLVIRRTELTSGGRRFGVRPEPGTYYSVDPARILLFRGPAPREMAVGDAIEAVYLDGFDKSSGGSNYPARVDFTRRKR